MHYCTKCERHTEDEFKDYPKTEEFEAGRDLIYREINCVVCHEFKMGFHKLVGDKAYGD